MALHQSRPIFSQSDVHGNLCVFYRMSDHQPPAGRFDSPRSGRYRPAAAAGVLFCFVNFLNRCGPDLPKPQASDSYDVTHT